MTNQRAKECFAVLDVETNWNNKVMSIGVVVADALSFAAVDCAYFILTPEYKVGGMFSSALGIVDKELTTLCSRAEMVRQTRTLFTRYNVRHVFAYNASFDYGCLPELTSYLWHDIMRVAAYRQYNGKIPHYADCYSTGRLKRGGGVENIMRLLTGQNAYCETHNALIDSMDELQIMQLLRHPISVYPEYTPGKAGSNSL